MSIRKERISSGTPFLPQDRYNEKDYDFVFRKPRRSRAHLAGWIVSAVLGFTLLYTFIPSRILRISRHSSVKVTAVTSNEYEHRVTTTQSSGKIWPSIPHFTNMFVFGDSFSETYFDLFGPLPSEANSLGNSNNTKPIWVDYLTSQYLKSPPRIYSLARGGSVIDSQLVKNTFGTSLTHQIHADFLPLYASSSPTVHWDSSNTLFTIWLGINDMVLAADASLRAPLDAIFASYRASLETLYDAGARNFLLMNVPPIHHVYEMKYDTKPLKSDIHWFNKHLLQLRQDFMRAHSADPEPITTALYFDVHELWTQVIVVPQSFPQTRQLKETKKYCLAYLLDETPGDGEDVYDESCKGRLSEYFWQNLHVTAKVHEVTAAILADDCLGGGGGGGAELGRRPKGYCS